MRRAPPRPPSAAAPPRIRRPCRRGARVTAQPFGDTQDTAVAGDMAACPTPARNGRPFGNGRRGIFSCFFFSFGENEKKNTHSPFSGSEERLL